jgi:hypothetical protein
MALQGSGAISLSQIQTELGGANPVSLSEYYRNGTYTGSNNTSVPTSGAISMSNFYGASSVDLVPDATAWNDIYQTGSSGGSTSGSANTVTVTGINTSITLSITLTGGYCNGAADNAFNATVDIWAVVNGVESTYISGTHTDSFSVTTFNISVSNNSTVYFAGILSVSDALEGAASGQAGGTITVRNVSSGNTVLDTFAVYLTAGAP